jgi:outer membrane protein OmpA-like peptidoglycan-associated protein
MPQIVTHAGDNFMRLALIAALLVAAATPGFAASGDVRNSKDHPAVSRYPGSVIKLQRIENHLPYRIATGPVSGYRAIAQWTDTAGRLTRTYYELAGARTHAEVHANFEKALRDGGFAILAAGMEAARNVGKQPGGRGWLEVYFAQNPIADQSGIVRLLSGSATSGGSGFVAGKKDRAEGPIYVAVTTTQYSKDVVAILIDVLESKAAETGLVAVNAEAMGKDVDAHGRVVLDGLFFEHDKATLKPESKAALDQIAKFLSMRPAMTFFVVGHTDGTGAFAYNRKLSEDRARAVVDALIAGYGVPARRLEAYGVGPLVPIFTNASDAGRGKNRRVELVQK